MENNQRNRCLMNSVVASIKEKKLKKLSMKKENIEEK
jgi:hypothetical protein